MENTEQKRPFGLGVMGMGGFGLFATQQFLQHPDSKLVAIAGSTREQAITTAKRFGADQLGSIEELVAHPDVDIVYIATPPFLHYRQAMLALNAGKHVICEKPLATDPDEGRELIETAQAKGLLMVTNLMQRYNPMFERVRHLIEKKLLGEVLHGYFENYAGDDGLAENHWFWNRQQSGGIFIEHGVHFFDMVEGWLGKGEVIAAQTIKRNADSDLEDQVSCTVRYGSVADGFKTVNFYHGFTQTGRLDRQELRLVFERGDITLHEWVPTRILLRAVADEETTRALMTLFPGAQLNVTANISGKDRQLRGRGKTFDAYQQIELRHGFGEEKQHLYSEILRLMFRDQLAFIQQPDTHRKVTEKNGLDSLLMAVAADAMARQ